MPRFVPVRLVRTLVLLLLATAPALGAQGTATVTGTVTDSARHAPLARATVILLRSGPDRAGEAFTATSGERGEFTLEVPPGSYQLTAEHPVLDSMESAVVPVALDLAAGARREIALATPSPATLKARACPGIALDSLTGAVIGRVADARDGGPIAGATILVQWDEVAAAKHTREVSMLTQTMHVEADEGGLFRACGLPLQVPLRAQVQRNGAQSGVLDLVISPRGVLARSVRIDTTGGRAAGEQFQSVVGKVEGPGGEGVKRARVRIAGDTLEATTDERGAFRLRTTFVGTHTLESVALGFTPARVPVDLVPDREASVVVQLEKTVAVLAEMRTVARRANGGVLRYDEFESRRNSKRGLYITPELLKQRNPFRVSDLLQELPGAGTLGARERRQMYLHLSFSIAPPEGFGGGGPKRPGPPDGEKEAAKVREPVGGGTSACPKTYVNGEAKGGAGLTLDNVPPDWVYGVEIYRWSDAAPPKYDNSCGVVIIWLK